MFRSRQFSGTNAVTFVVYGGLGGALFLLPVELQDALRYSPIAAGAALLPVTALMLALPVLAQQGFRLDEEAPEMSAGQEPCESR